MTPPDQEEAIIQAKLSLAITYANPLLNKELQKNAVDYYGEIRDWYARQKPRPGEQNYIQMIIAIYNRGVAYLLNFEDYEAAIAEFAQIKEFRAIEPDAQVFTAYAQAKNKQPERARETLKSIDWTDYPDPVRIAFLRCYIQLTERILGDRTTLEACFNLQSPQTDVLLDLTSTIAKLKLSTTEENKNLKMFYRFFTDHLRPDIQNSMGSAITSADLERANAESRLKTLQLKNMSLYQNLSYALLGIAFLCLIALLIVIKSWRDSRRHAQEMSEGRAQLQSIIDNVEEGLVRIGPDLRLIPQVSPHLLQITGGRDLKDHALKDLFDLTNLDADSIAIAVQSVDASIGQDSVAWNLNQHNLPVAATILGREIAFYWQAECTGDEVHSLLLVLRDVTEVNELHRQTAQAQEKADRILVFAREITACNPRSIRQFMSELPQQLEQFATWALKDNTSELKKLAHMLKGTARALGLIAFQNAMHEFEDRMKAENSSEWKNYIPTIKDIIAAYRAASEHVLGPSEVQESAQTLFDLVALLRPGLEKQLRQAEIALGTFAVVENISVPPSDLEQLKEVILHGLTNAADHGFILPKQQGRQVPSSASFRVEISRDQDKTILTLRDNGVGLNHQKIRELAAKRKWEPGHGEIWSDFLFQEGVSTAENLSMTSGRGVGLAAIFSASQHLGGSVKLLDNDAGPGGMIQLVWPFRQSAAA